jgi:hypothetical protein
MADETSESFEGALEPLEVCCAPECFEVVLDALEVDGPPECIEGALETLELDCLEPGCCTRDLFWSEHALPGRVEATERRMWERRTDCTGGVEGTDGRLSYMAQLLPPPPLASASSS